MSRPKWMTATSKNDRRAQRREMAHMAIEAELRALPPTDACAILLAITEQWLPGIREAARAEFARRIANAPAGGEGGR